MTATRRGRLSPIGDSAGGAGSPRSGRAGRRRPPARWSCPRAPTRRTTAARAKKGGFDRCRECPARPGRGARLQGRAARSKLPRDCARARRGALPRAAAGGGPGGREANTLGLGRTVRVGRAVSLGVAVRVGHPRTRARAAPRARGLPARRGLQARRALRARLVRIRGNKRTLSRVILRHVPFRPGDEIDVETSASSSPATACSAPGISATSRLLSKGPRRGVVILNIDVVERNTIVINDLWMGLSADASAEGKVAPAHRVRRRRLRREQLPRHRHRPRRRARRGRPPERVSHPLRRPLVPRQQVDCRHDAPLQRRPRLLRHPRRALRAATRRDRDHRLRRAQVPPLRRRILPSGTTSPPQCGSAARSTSRGFDSDPARGLAPPRPRHRAD